MGEAYFDHTIYIHCMLNIHLYVEIKTDEPQGRYGVCETIKMLQSEGE